MRDVEPENPPGERQDLVVRTFGSSGFVDKVVLAVEGNPLVKGFVGLRSAGYSREDIVAVVDVDNDGDEDLVWVQSQGDGSFASAVTVWTVV